MSASVTAIPLQIKNLQDDKEACQTANKSLADYNMSKQPQLAQQKATLAAKSTAAKRLYEEFQSKSSQMGNELTIHPH